MLCALFKSCLILAAPPKSSDTDRRYEITASISLMDLRIEAADSGKGSSRANNMVTLILIQSGLQCYTAPFSWKIVFESDHRLFEILCSAANAEEEQQWRVHLTDLSAKAVQSAYESTPLSPHQYSHICLDLRPNGQALGVPGTLARRLSVQRAATIGPRANVYQVVIRDTTAPESEPERPPGPSGRFGRSRSLLSTNGRIPVLCPKRSDRARIEHAMAKVWSKEILPYPVMKTNQKENMIRASASSVMRKLSRSTIANSLSKRTMSHRKTSAAYSGEDSKDDGFEESQLRPCNQANLPSRPESRGQFSIHDANESSKVQAVSKQGSDRDR